MLIDREKKMKKARQHMVKEHLIKRGIRDERVIQAMGNIRREDFVPEKYQADSYGDHPLPIGYNQTISQPYIVALMSELCAFTGREKVLEIGCGSGYQSAVLSNLAEKIISIERIKELSERAKALLHKKGFDNITVIHGDGYDGLPDEAPFDVILLTAAPGEIPQTLTDQLADGGRLIAPVGHNVQELIHLKKESGVLSRNLITYVSFVPMLRGYN